MRFPAVHEQRLERWLGAETLAGLHANMARWYGPPIGVANVPGKVYVTPDGFCGKIDGGGFASLLDRLDERTRRAARRSMREPSVGGFSSLGHLILSRSGGKGRTFPFTKVGTAGVVAGTNSLWRVGVMPTNGAAAAAAPGGTVPTDATTGSFPFANPSGGDTQHFTTAWSRSTAINCLLLYDRIFAVAKTMNSTATEAVTGVPTRYQSTTAGNMDYVGGNFLFPETGTALAATAHNWDVMQYTDDAGNATQTLPLITGNSGNIINRLDMPVGYWFAPLASGDVGIKALSQMQCSALVATGAIDFVIGHPIAFLPCPVVNLICVADGINSAFNLERVFDDACLAFLEVTMPATTATTYSGMFQTVAGSY